MQDAIQIIEVLLPDRYIWVHTKFCPDRFDLCTSHLLCLELRDVCFGWITRHQAWDDEIERYRGPQRYQVEARTPQEIAHYSVSPCSSFARRRNENCRGDPCGRPIRINLKCRSGIP